MSHEVFISYATEDKPIADAVCAHLEAKRVRCWIAPRDVFPGLPYAEAISEALAASRLLVLVLSSHSNASQQVAREVEAAVAEGFPVIPLRVENVQPSKSMAYFIKSVHWLDALTPPLEHHLRTLADTIHLLLARSAPSKMEEEIASHSVALPHAEPARANGSGRKRLRVAVAAGVLSSLFCATAFIVVNTRSPTPRTPISEGVPITETAVEAKELRSMAASVSSDVRDLRQQVNTTQTRSKVAADGLSRALAVVLMDPAGRSNSEAMREGSQYHQLACDTLAEIDAIDARIKSASAKRAELPKLLDRASRLYWRLEAEAAQPPKEDSPATESRSRDLVELKSLLVSCSVREGEIDQDLAEIRSVRTQLASRRMELEFLVLQGNQAGFKGSPR
jgi:hypothetical protein